MRLAALLAAGVVALAAPVAGATRVDAPRGPAQIVGQFTGVGIGTLDRFRMIRNSSFNSHSTDFYKGRFTYSFSIDEGGNVTGSGTGRYLVASWRLRGVVHDKGTFACEVPMTTRGFTVRVTGQATADTITLRFALEGSGESNDDHPCGADFTGFASDSTRLADSLELVQQPEGIRTPRALPNIRSLRRVEQLGDDSDRRVNIHDWAFSIAAPGAPPPPDPPDTGGGGGGDPGGGAGPPIALVGTVGPGNRVSLTLDGRAVTILPARAYRIVVRDRSRGHNFHLTGPGVNRSTPVRRTGTFTWNVTLRAGSYRYRSDPQGNRLRRSVLVR
jgi:hypothetical protein